MFTIIHQQREKKKTLVRFNITMYSGLFDTSANIKNKKKKTIQAVFRQRAYKNIKICSSSKIWH